MAVMDEGGGGRFASWKWFEVSINEENLCGKILYRWGDQWVARVLFNCLLDIRNYVYVFFMCWYI